MKKGFTLAEIMIVLSVIAVLTAILLPAARNAMPNEKVMKFKKGHETLLNVISELVNSDKYYLDGDLGVKPNGELVNEGEGWVESDRMYLIQTFADVLSVKHSEPKTESGHTAYMGMFDYNTCTINSTVGVLINTCQGVDSPDEIFFTRKSSINQSCQKAVSSYAKQIVMDNGVWYWDGNTHATFGEAEMTNGKGRRLFHLTDNNGIYTMYKIFCMDVDGVPENATATDCINECPFAYGIRVDGKIFTSKRVDEWLEKSIQDKN